MVYLPAPEVEEVVLPDEELTPEVPEVAEVADVPLLETPEVVPRVVEPVEDEALAPTVAPLLVPLPVPLPVPAVVLPVLSSAFPGVAQPEISATISSCNRPMEKR